MTPREPAPATPATTRWARRWRKRLRALVRRDAVDRELDEELAFHLELETEKHLRAGLGPDEARRRAALAFGDVERHKQAVRDARHLRVPDVSLDLRLGLRMLVKHPGLTLVGGFAIAMATTIGAISFEAVTEVLRDRVPLDEGDRVVSLQYATSNPGNPERRVLRDFVAWRDELRAVRQIGAFRNVQRNLVPADGTADGTADPVMTAEITASGFDVARTPPLLGRYLLPADERPGAPPVVVVGHEAWRTRFDGDSAVVGRAIDLGGVAHVVVGVMPPKFEFPLYHQFWVPLRADPLAHAAPLTGPALYVFGRLAPGATIAEAQAELETVARRAAAAYPREYRGLRPLVTPYPWEHLFVDDPALQRTLWGWQLAVSALMVVVLVNLAVLVYARTVVRRGETAVRIALGASRARILAQLFVEALVLSALGAAAGLLQAQVILRAVQAWTATANRLPFWIDLGLSAGTALYAFGFAVLAAVVVGVLPGLRATDRRVHGALRQAASGGGKGVGGLWTFLIVAQVAIAVAVLPAAVSTVGRLVRMELSGPGVPAERLVVAQLQPNEGAGPGRPAELLRRLEGEPGVAAVAYSDRVPLLETPRRIDVDGAAAEVRALRAGPRLFDVYGATILAGRPLGAGDVGGARAVVVNRRFVERVLGNAPALGRRFRYAEAAAHEEESTPRTTYEIVGVVSDFPTLLPPPGQEPAAKVYHAAAPEELDALSITVRLRGAIPDDFAARVSRVGVAVDPATPMRVVPLAEYYRQQRSFFRYGAWALGLVLTSVLLLSGAGIYALTSFTVAQRAREIGIRAALGAPRRHILAGVFGRVARQLALGVGVGSLLSSALFALSGVGLARAAALLLGVAGLIAAVALVAALGPARRGLRIQPTEALRES